MNLVRLIDFLRDRLKGVVAVGYGVLALVVVADVVRLLGGHGGHHAAAPAEGAHAAEAAGQSHGFWTSAYHFAEAVPGFWAVFGLLGCLVLVIVSKTYGHTPISVREDYYHG